MDRTAGNPLFAMEFALAMRDEGFIVTEVRPRPLLYPVNPIYVYMCVCIYIYICVCVCVCVCIHTYTYTYMCVHM